MPNNRYKTSLLGLVLFMFLFATACDSKKNEAGNASMISGTGSKTWKAERETTASGDKDKLTRSEKKERITFYSNGKFNMLSDNDQMNGTWTYDAPGRNLSMQFEGDNHTENFQIENLTEKKMKLKAPDGSGMELEAE